MVFESCFKEILFWSGENWLLVRVRDKTFPLKRQLEGGGVLNPSVKIYFFERNFWFKRTSITVAEMGHRQSAGFSLPPPPSLASQGKREGGGVSSGNPLIFFKPPALQLSYDIAWSCQKKWFGVMVLFSIRRREISTILAEKTFISIHFWPKKYI